MVVDLQDWVIHFKNRKVMSRELTIGEDLPQDYTKRPAGVGGWVGGGEEGCQTNHSIIELYTNTYMSLLKVNI